MVKEVVKEVEEVEEKQRNQSGPASKLHRDPHKLSNPTA